MSFRNKLKLVLKILGENADMVLEILIDVFPELSKLCADLCFELSEF